MRFRTVRVFLAALVFAATPCIAQNSGLLPMNASVNVRLRDGSVLKGRLTEQTTDSVEVTTASGRFTVARAAIADLHMLSAEDIQRGDYWAPDPHDTRLFFGPTGRTLAKGSGYFADTYVLLFNGGVGITDRFMLSGGMTVVPTSDFFHENLYYVAPKFALVRRDSFNVAIGGFYGFSGRIAGNATMYYVAATNGGPDRSFTYGLAYANAAGTIHDAKMLMFGGNVRVARKVSLMTENYVTFVREAVAWAPVYGVRFIGEKLSSDLGFVNYVGHNAQPVFPGVPWLGFALKF